MKEYLITLTFLLAVALFAVPATAAIVSDFTYTVDPSDPLTIHFTEKSTGGVTDDSGGSGSSSGGSSSSGGNSGGGISLPDISLGGISIPNPMDIIGEYIKLIRVMIIPSNYNI